MLVNNVLSILRTVLVDRCVLIYPENRIVHQR
jgi:hypothetical protein